MGKYIIYLLFFVPAFCFGQDTKPALEQIQDVTVGTYTPTLYNTTNVDASTASVLGYYRIGNSVTVYGDVMINANTASTATVLGMSLPIASAFTLTGDLGGAFHAVAIPVNSAVAYADTANDRVYASYRSTADVGDVYYAVHFSYLIK